MILSISQIHEITLICCIISRCFTKNMSIIRKKKDAKLHPWKRWSGVVFSACARVTSPLMWSAARCVLFSGTLALWPWAPLRPSPAAIDAQISLRCWDVYSCTLGCCGWPGSPGSSSVCLWGRCCGFPPLLSSTFYDKETYRGCFFPFVFVQQLRVHPFIIFCCIPPPPLLFFSYLSA